jgi:hypothetical protein
MSKIKQYEIWLGESKHNAEEPKMVGEIAATNFKVACFKYELMSKMEALVEAEKKGEEITENWLKWHYNPMTNSNAWVGKYYESKEAAQESFEKKSTIIKDV